MCRYATSSLQLEPPLDSIGTSCISGYLNQLAIDGDNNTSRPVFLGSNKKVDLEQLVQKWKDPLIQYGLRLNLNKIEF